MARPSRSGRTKASPYADPYLLSIICDTAGVPLFVRSVEATQAPP